VAYLIKYSEPADQQVCTVCGSINTKFLPSDNINCTNCGEVSPVTEEHFYLNHAYLSSCAFGSLDMAWSTEDKEKAELMLYKVQQHHPDNHNIELEEY